jgi:hypothetical protein
MDAQLEDFPNLLGEAERAVGRVLHELARQRWHCASSSRRPATTKTTTTGELSAHIRRLGGSASHKTGDFVEKGHAIADFNGKLELLNRGQPWVIRKIDQSLPSISGEPLERCVPACDGHHINNIGALEEALKEGLI